MDLQLLSWRETGQAFYSIPALILASTAKSCVHTQQLFNSYVTRGYARTNTPVSNHQLLMVSSSCPRPELEIPALVVGRPLLYSLTLVGLHSVLPHSRSRSTAKLRNGKNVNLWKEKSEDFNRALPNSLCFLNPETLAFHLHTPSQYHWNSK